jgi:hypothetical protein
VKRIAISLPQALGRASFGKSHPGIELWNHVSAEHDLEIPKLPFVLDGAPRTYAIDDKAIRFRCVLEPLLPTP